MIGVVVNTYRRLQNLERQLDALLGQSVPPSVILAWRNDREETDAFDQRGIRYVQASENMGVWPRFALARELRTDFYCVFDDDTIPGKDWLKNCLEQHEKLPGLYAASGFRFRYPTVTRETFHNRTQHGWIAPPAETLRVDWPGHAWFFSKEVLFRSLAVEPADCRTAGEDAHLAFTVQQMGMNCYIPPHDRRRLNWGSVHGGLGNDKEAAYRLPGQPDNMIRCLNYYKQLGWRFCCEDSE